MTPHPQDILLAALRSRRNWQNSPPAIWMAAGSPASLQKVAKRNANLLLDQFADTKLTGERIEIYRSGLASHGHTFDPLRVAVARDIFIAKDRPDKEAALERLNTS